MLKAIKEKSNLGSEANIVIGNVYFSYYVLFDVGRPKTANYVAIEHFHIGQAKTCCLYSNLKNQKHSNHFEVESPRSHLKGANLLKSFLG